MRRFRFNLQRVLEYRQWREEGKKREFAAAQGARVGMQVHLRGLRLAREEQKRVLRDMELGAINMEALRSQVSHIIGIERNIKRCEERLEDLRAAEEKKRQELVQATKEKKALENLRRRRLMEWRREADREERKFLDEIRAKPITTRVLAE